MHAVCSAGTSFAGSYAQGISVNSMPMVSAAYLGVEWDVLTGNQQRNDDTSPCQQGNLGPDEPAFSPVYG